MEPTVEEIELAMADRCEHCYAGRSPREQVWCISCGGSGRKFFIRSFKDKRYYKRYYYRAVFLRHKPPYLVARPWVSHIFNENPRVNKYSPSIRMDKL